MTEEKRPTIAENERSPVSDAAQESGGAGPEDEREEPRGTSEATSPKTDSQGKPIVPPSRRGN